VNEKPEIEDLPVPVRFEALTEANIATIQRSFTGIQAVVLGVDRIDRKAGAGVFEDGSKCIWSRDGRRIRIKVAHGQLIASASKNPDPLSKPENRGAL
jgi:hypothetical protein